MKKEIAAFDSEKEFADMARLLEAWKDDPQKIKFVFLKMKDALLKKDHTALRFISRPGVSYSLRASLKNRDKKKNQLFALVDIIDDDPQNRWLSVCFYTEMITDPEEIGNLVPAGILGADGYCFDLFEFDEALISYVTQKIDQAYAYITGVSF